MKVNINRQLAGLEDIAFGTGTVMQERQGELVEITKINLGNLPFDETLSAAEVLTPIYEQVVPHMAEILEADTNASIATTKAAEALSSATTSATKASESAASAVSSAASAATASAKSIEADASAASASSSEINAAASASDALSSANTAASQATTATTKASEANTSALASASSATTASTQVGIATTKAAEATTKAAEASDSAAAALASEQATAASEGLISTHLTANGNPHSVTKEQVGLGSVDNTSDADKPISIAQQLALDGKSDDNNVLHLTGDETAAGIKTFADGLRTQGHFLTPYGRNYIINGGFDYWNYATSQTTSGYGSDNRWFNSHNGSTKTHSRVASGDTERALFNSPYFSRTVVTSVAGSSNFVTKRTSIENVTKLAGKTVTLSFWAKADSSKNIWVEFKQVFGTGGSPSSAVLGLYGQAVYLTSTWQKKTITLTLPSIIGKTLGTDGVHTSYTEMQLWFDVGSGSIGRIPTGIQQSGTFDIAEVKLEEGTVATPWTPYEGEFGGEVQACQRYYQRYGFGDYGIQHEGYGLAGNAVGITTIYPTMRTYPTLSIIGTWVVSNCAQPTVGGFANSSMQIKTVATTTGQVIFRTTPTSGITASAEL